MKKPTLLSTLVLGAWCALLTAQAQPAAPANPPASQAEATSEPADDILPLVQFEDAPLVDVIKTLARALGVEAEHFREYRLRVITDRLERMPALIDKLYRRYGT